MMKITLESSKNLLAFSGGVDSTALFFLLEDNQIPFDIAIVDYGKRESAKDEVIYATQLAHKYNKKCFISTYPNHFKFNEKSARDYRYKFFEDIIKEHDYHSLITAHQLNDKLEWFLMQLSLGAGLNELLGMQKRIDKENYSIYRPLLECSKEQLQNYLDENRYKYFIDESNFDEKFRRNYFRHNFSDKLIKEHQEGIVKSFRYLSEDQNSLLKDISKKEYEELSIFSFNGDMNIAVKIIDKELKKRGYLITKATRDEICEKKELVISHKIAVAIVDKKIYIAPYINIPMEKKFKEKCRVYKLPKQIRAYLFSLKDFNFSILQE